MSWASATADVLDHLLRRLFGSRGFKGHLRSFVSATGPNQTLLKSQPQFCAMGADGGQRDILPLANAELMQLRIRVIELENLLVALLTEASERQ